MESSETRAARLGAERCRDRALEERGVAPGKKNAARLGAHIVFADESGFLLIPTVVRTWAPQGETPIHRHRQGRRDKLSVISGISVSPKRRRLSLYSQIPRRFYPLQFLSSRLSTARSICSCFLVKVTIRPSLKPLLGSRRYTRYNPSNSLSAS